MRGAMLEDVAAPPSRTTATTITMPPDSCQILALHVDIGSYTLGSECPHQRFSSKWGCQTLHVGIGFERSVFVVHAGVPLKTSPLDRIHWFGALHSGVGL